MRTSTYRPRAPFVEAVLFEHPDDGSVIAEWCGGSNEREPEAVDVPSPRGRMTARIGDYVIKGVTGEFFVCAANAFTATYEAVNPDMAARISGAVREATENPGRTVAVDEAWKGFPLDGDEVQR